MRFFECVYPISNDFTFNVFFILCNFSHTISDITGMGLILKNIQRKHVYFKTHVRFQFSLSFTASTFSRYDMIFLGFLQLVGIITRTLVPPTGNYIH